ncbi:MAG: M48 family metallopeptidase [Boseongicola sp.]
MSDAVISTPFHVGAGHARPKGFADFFDGISAISHRVEFEFDDVSRTLVIHQAESPPFIWAIDELRAIPDQADKKKLVLTSKARPLARLIFSGETEIAVLRHRAPKLSAKPPVRGKRRVIAWAAAAVASVFVIVFVLVPVMADQLARVLPTRGEQALGEATLEQIQSALGTEYLPVDFCWTPDGQDALDTMLARLGGGELDLPYLVTVSVLDHEMINAFALPGGQVVFFRGMLDAASSPDEIAAVLAHEIGHVAARDPTRIALRSAGSLGVLGLLFGDFAGGAVVLLLVEQLIQADYSREAEAAADSFGIELLLDADVDPGALGTLFQKILDQFGSASGIAAHFASHPTLGDRIANAQAASGRLSAPSPSLSGEEWQSLQAICD